MLQSPTQQNTQKIYVTDLMDMKYCPRLFSLKKFGRPPRKVSTAAFFGTLEHEVRRVATKSLQTAYDACSNISDLKNLDYKKPLQESLEYAYDLGEKTYPVNAGNIQAAMPELGYRLDIEEKKRLQKAISMAKKGVKVSKISETLFPWATEKGVGSSTLGITGRIDEVYKIGKKLIPVDFKTHTSRFASFLWRDAHAEQLAAYAFLLELQYDGFKAKHGIVKYTQDLYDHQVKFSADNHNMIISHIDKARTLIDEQKIPKKLCGAESIKCKHCYLREFCFAKPNGGNT